MGLDMYAFSTRVSPTKPVDFSDEIGEDDAEEFFYWRKHPNLHGWMEKLYRAKNGEEGSFNCVPVALAPEDLDRLEQDIRGNSLPETEGFFFGQSYKDQDEIDNDLDFIKKARDEIAAGKTVFYYSWW
ncbi:MAG: phosphoglycerate kinase [Alphaproteobacteria bacterium]|nr:phosphoglycerate kinase [Alphaproteobacteria bacterium]